MLQGPRVLLRAIEPDDLPLLCRFRNDIELRWLTEEDPPVPESYAQVQARYFEEANKPASSVRFAIEADERFIGHCTLFHVDELSHTCEVGITIGEPEYRSRGYGREVVRLLLGYAFRIRNFHKVWLQCLAGNEPALRCYRACGFVEEGRLRQHAWVDGGYQDLVYMGLLRSEWEPGPGR